MFKRIFLRGLVTLLPLVLTMALCSWLFERLEAGFGRRLEAVLPAGCYFPGMGILVGVVVVFAVGLLMHAWVVSQIYGFGERLVRRIPLIKTVYNLFTELMRVLEAPKQTGSKTVLVRWAGQKVFGLVTAEGSDPANGLPPGLLGREELLVYVPFSYMLGGGVTLVVSAQDVVQRFPWAWDQTLRFVATAGLAGHAEAAPPGVPRPPVDMQGDL